MLGTHDLWLFVLSGLALNVTPGPDTLYIVGRSTSRGVEGGVVAALGIGAGALVHVFAAALGLSAILAASATAFTIVKWLGAGYLIYVGLSLLRSSWQRVPLTPATAHTVGRPASEVAAAASATRAIFLQGFLTNVLNPKVALFFLAFLPQFVASDAPSKPLAFVFLGLIFDLNGTLWNLAVAWSAARIGRRLAGGAQFKRWFERGVGGLFVLVGVKLAMSRTVS